MSDIRPVSRSEKCANDSKSYYDFFYSHSRNFYDESDEGEREEGEEDDDGFSVSQRDQRERRDGSHKNKKFHDVHYFSDEISRRELERKDGKSSFLNDKGFFRVGRGPLWADGVGQFLNFLRRKVSCFFFEPFSFFSKGKEVYFSNFWTKSFDLPFKGWGNFWGDVVACCQFYKKSNRLGNFLDFSDQRRCFRKGK